ncbi:MAG: glycosyltransferase, partial [Actinomycetes bacterium]
AGKAAAGTTGSRAPSQQLRWRVLSARILVRRELMRLRLRGQHRVELTVEQGWSRWDEAYPSRTWAARATTDLPDVRDVEEAFAPVLAGLHPDAVHAHDLGVLRLAVRTARRRGRAGHRVGVVYDAIEYWAGLSPAQQGSPRRQKAMLALEARYARRADAVLTVSDPIADELVRRYRLARRPEVALNTPPRPARPGDAPSLRSSAGVDRGTPLAVYSGILHAGRSIDTLLEALPGVPQLHLAVVVVPYPNLLADRLVERAAALGVLDRVHIVAPVDPDRLVDFLAEADVGLHALAPDCPNHRMALPNKLFEYAHAGLRLVVSDADAMAEHVRTHRLGLVYRYADAGDLARALRESLALPTPGPDDRDAWRAAYGWEAQEPAVAVAYRHVLGTGRVGGPPSGPFPSLREWTAGDLEHASSPRPHVVLVRPYPLTTDTRARKIALSLSRAGYQVTIAALSGDQAAHEARLGPCRVVLLPLVDANHDARVRRARRRQWRPRVPGLGGPAALSGRISSLYQEVGRVRATRRMTGRTRTGLLRAEVLVLRGVRAAQVRVDATTGTAWSRWDALLPTITWAAHWTRDRPDVADTTATFSALLTRLTPDVVHAHDPRALPVALSVARPRPGRARTRVVYDARENWAGFPPEEQGPRRAHAALVALERDLAPQADLVLTVAEPIRDELVRRWRLTRPPTVLLNAPVRRLRPARGPDGLRAAAGLDDHGPVAVYSGGISGPRGVDVLIDALPDVPELHVVLVPVPYPHPDLDRLLAHAETRGVRDRLHLVAPVDSEQVVDFLTDADIGVHPLRAGSANHEMAMPNKLFEYLHAGLALVVTDTASMGGFVRNHGIGETFADGDPADLARALRAVLADRGRYTDPARRAALVRTFSWQSQEPALWLGYARMLGAPPPTPPPSTGEGFPPLVVEQP